LADLTVTEARERLVLDWSQPYRHATFYKAVYRPAVLRANRAATASGTTGALLPPQLRFHALRHTYASLMIAAGRPMFEVARFMGPLEAEHHRDGLRAPARGRPHRRDGRAGRDGG